MHYLGELFGLGKSTIVKVCNKFIQAVFRASLHYIHWPTSRGALKAGFCSKNGLPNCCGAIDATHVIIGLPSNESPITFYSCYRAYIVVM